MHRKFLSLGTTLLLAVLAVSCATSSTRQHTANHDNADALIGAITRSGGSTATRLHPDQINAMLIDRAGDPAVNAAFDQVLRKDTPETRSALINALELKFILDPDTSALDLLGDELSEHFRTFDWQYGDYPGGPDGPNEAFADVMVDALDNIVPERRANSKRDAVVVRSQATEEVWEFMLAQWIPVTGQERWKLNRHAQAAFIRMREQAALDGVELVILSGHRDPKVAKANAARANNPAAVASFSSHSLGLAIDFQMSQPGIELSEVTTRPMSDVVRMRQSPAHKWLAVHAHKFGWFPYQNEPWHWEYNPVGFREIFWADYPGGAPPGP